MIWMAIRVWWTRNDDAAACLCIHAAQCMSPLNREQIADYMLTLNKVEAAKGGRDEC